MTPIETTRALTYLIAYSNLRPMVSPSACMEYLNAVAPIKEDSPEYNEIEYDFYLWWLTKRVNHWCDTQYQANQLLDLWTELSRLTSDGRTIEGDIAIGGMTYRYKALKTVLGDLLIDGLMRSLNK